MKIGVIVKDMNCAEFIKEGNLAAETNDITFFYEETGPVAHINNFALMPIGELWGFDGTLISTDLSTTALLLQLPRAKERYFFINELDWVKMGYKDFYSLYHIYGNSEIKQLTKNEEYAKIMKQVWGSEPILTDSLFNLKGIVNAER